MRQLERAQAAGIVAQGSRDFRLRDAGGSSHEQARKIRLRTRAGRSRMSGLLATSERPRRGGIDDQVGARPCPSENAFHRSIPGLAWRRTAVRRVAWAGRGLLAGLSARCVRFSQGRLRRQVCVKRTRPAADPRPVRLGRAGASPRPRTNRGTSAQTAQEARSAWTWARAACSPIGSRGFTCMPKAWKQRSSSAMASSSSLTHRM